ncbi:unnamed protein product [Owenia fusiformis]|uniref:Uncharacterized protein n=1 Tax=Owenia fusiformis TaxID=6347 RepID=A0A8S4Q675_OWEFU|nr:unnamed protein product [Owenia fusiformis]
MSVNDKEDANNNIHEEKQNGVIGEVHDAKRTLLKKHEQFEVDMPQGDDQKHRIFTKKFIIGIIMILCVVGIVVAVVISTSGRNEINSRLTVASSTAKTEYSREELLIMCHLTTTTQPPTTDSSLVEECSWLLKHDYEISENGNTTKQFLCKTYPHVLPKLCSL